MNEIRIQITKNARTLITVYAASILLYYGAMAIYNAMFGLSVTVYDFNIIFLSLCVYVIGVTRKKEDQSHE